MTTQKRPIPAGFHSITPHLEVRGAAKAIEFYKQAFGAKELVRNSGPDGQSIMHCELMIGDSMIMLHDEYAETGGESPQTLEGSPVTLHLFVDDADSTFDRAVKAGAKVDTPMGDQFWGDRYGQITDPFGHHWSIAHRITELSPEDIRKRAAEYFEG